MYSFIPKFISCNERKTLSSEKNHLRNIISIFDMTNPRDFKLHNFLDQSRASENFNLVPLGAFPFSLFFLREKHPGNEVAKMVSRDGLLLDYLGKGMNEGGNF